MNVAKSYIPPVGFSEVMRACIVGVVIESNNPAFAVGDSVTGYHGVQQYGVSDSKDLVKGDHKLPTG